MNLLLFPEHNVKFTNIFYFIIHVTCKELLICKNSLRVRIKMINKKTHK